MKRLLAATFSLTFAASVLGASLDPDAIDSADSADAGSLNASLLLDNDTVSTNQACCWMYFGGRWWCVPCQ